jgi:hypothetical protein
MRTGEIWASISSLTIWTLAMLMVIESGGGMPWL